MKLISQKIQEFISFTTTSIEAHPFLKGGVPAIAGGAISFIDHLETWLRLGSFITGFCIGILTLYLTIRKVIKEHKK